MMANNHLPSMATPEATIPQANAHIGGNQVMGLNNSVTAESCGRAIECVLRMTHTGVKLNLHKLWFTPRTLLEKRPEENVSD
jgi:hypothetical protein